MHCFWQFLIFLVNFPCLCCQGSQRLGRMLGGDQPQWEQHRFDAPGLHLIAFNPNLHPVPHSCFQWLINLVLSMNIFMQMSTSAFWIRKNVDYDHWSSLITDFLTTPSIHACMDKSDQAGCRQGPNRSKRLCSSPCGHSNRSSRRKRTWCLIALKGTRLGAYQLFEHIIDIVSIQAATFLYWSACDRFQVDQMEKRANEASASIKSWKNAKNRMN